MILHEFPDLLWLKSQIEHRFANRLGWNYQGLATEGFPTVIIHTHTKTAYRPDVKGPLSLFLNRKGSSFCRTDTHRVRVSEAFYFVSNRSQPYTLEIDEDEPVETFNIHFGEYFSEAQLHALTTPADSILEGAGEQLQGPGIAFHNKLYTRDPAFDRITERIYRASKEGAPDKLFLEEQLAQLLTHLLRQHRHILAAIRDLPPAKTSTKVELYRRLSYSLDYIHSDQTGQIDLDSLAATACLSKYHFLRLFKLTYGSSPHQYLQQLRMDKARHLLTNSSLLVTDIADTLGFENSQSFSRWLFQRLGVYPSQYRAAAK